MKTLLVFDLDDTLIPSKKIYEQLIQTLPMGLDPDSYLKGRTLAQQSLPESAPSRFHRLIYFKNALQLKDQFSAAKLLNLMRLYEDQLVDLVHQFWLGSPAQEALKRLKRQNQTMVLLTNETLRTQLLKLTAIDPNGEYFDHVFTSEEVGHNKPHSAMFKAVERTYPNHNYVMIGDSMEFDIQPAQARNWRSLHVEDSSRLLDLLKQAGFIHD